MQDAALVMAAMKMTEKEEGNKYTKVSCLGSPRNNKVTSRLLSGGGSLFIVMSMEKIKITAEIF
jgi:hypothetical protein